MRFNKTGADSILDKLNREVVYCQQRLAHSKFFNRKDLIKDYETRIERAKENMIKVERDREFW